MSAISTPTLEHSLNVLIVVLFISVDETSVNRVGLVIKGKHEWQYKLFTKDSVSILDSYLRRSTL